MIDKYLEIQFVNRVGVYLKNFKQVKARNWAFTHSCETPSKGGKLRVRGGIYEYKPNEEFMVKCFHCGYSARFTTLLKDVAPSLYDEYKLSGYREKVEQPKPIVLKPPSKKLADANLLGLTEVTSLSPTNPVIRFLERRKIPIKHYKLLFVAKHFYQWASRYKPDFAKIKDDSPRLVMPYYSESGRVIGFTARTFSPTVEPRYIHLRIDKDTDFVYGTERIDPGKPIYICEGNIDSLFLDNAIAVGGANYFNDYVRSIKSNCVIIPDSDWKRNKQVGLQLKKAIKDGYQVAFIPDTVKGKDINDIIKDGMSSDELKILIDNNTKSGLNALLEFALMKRY